MRAGWWVMLLCMNLVNMMMSVLSGTGWWITSGIGATICAVVAFRIQWGERVNAEPQLPAGAVLKSKADQTYTIPGETTSRWKVGDEIVAVATDIGTVIISREYAERMGIKGKHGKVVDG